METKEEEELLHMDLRKHRGRTMDFGENCGRVVGNYILGKKIGTGSFAVVWKATNRMTGDEVAVKEIDKKKLSNIKVKENLLKEIEILSHIKHPNIVRLHEPMEVWIRSSFGFFLFPLSF